MDKLKLVKITVSLMTFLLIFGTLLMLSTIYKKTRIPSTLPVAASLNQPQGSLIADYQMIDGNLYILVKNGGLSDRIIIFNPQLGQTATTIKLN